MKRTRLLTILLIAAVVIVLTSPVLARSGGVMSSAQDIGCDTSKHSGGTATITMAGSSLNPHAGQQVTVSVTVAGANTGGRLGVLIASSASSGQLTGGWAILTDPSGTQFNYNQIAAATTSNTFTWTLTAPTSGSHTLYSKAFYAGPAGVTFTQGLIFTVGGGGGGVQSNTSVTITTPIAGISAVGTVDINTNIVNLAGISYAILRIDGTIVSNLTATPFIWSWNTSQYADGLHTINITAAGADGTFGYAQQTLTVANTASMSLDQNAWQWTILALLMSSIAVIAAVMVLILMMKKRRMGGDV